jgi:L-2-hydroxyglutarate oxidase LhgO
LNGSVEFQQRLVQYLLTVKGKVILSGYANEDYAALESAGWERKDVVHKMSLNAKEKNKDRIESIWMNFHTNISPLFK